MTAKELYEELDELIKQGLGDTKVYFDTEAQSYDVHIVPIGSIEAIPAGIVDDESYVILHGEIK